MEQENVKNGIEYMILMSTMILKIQIVALHMFVPFLEPQLNTLILVGEELDDHLQKKVNDFN